MQEGYERRRRVRGVTPELLAAAKELRHRMTPAEQVLWRALQNRQLGGLRFRNQYPVGPFVLDFYCPAYKLVIEVDGSIHEQQTEQDAARTEHLEAYGYRVLRFHNDEVLTNLAGVLERILLVATEARPQDYQGENGPESSTNAETAAALTPPRIGGLGGQNGNADRTQHRGSSPRHHNHPLHQWRVCRDAQ
jgi:very-short-patch-repair endonuclease